MSLSQFFKNIKNGAIVSLSTSLVLVAGAFGFGFVTPAHQFQQIRSEVAHIDTVHMHRIDSLAIDHLRLEQTLSDIAKSDTAVLRGQCLDRPTRELRLMGLNCRVLLHQ